VEKANLSQKRYLNQKELAEYLNASPSWIREKTARRIIPCIKLPGSAPRFEPKKVDAALAKFEMKEVGRGL
jgi:excisionase family DNA binding protein